MPRDRTYSLSNRLPLSLSLAGVASLAILRRLDAGFTEFGSQIGFWIAWGLIGLGIATALLALLDTQPQVGKLRARSLPALLALVLPLAAYVVGELEVDFVARERPAFVPLALPIESVSAHPVCIDSFGLISYHGRILARPGDDDETIVLAEALKEIAAEMEQEQFSPAHGTGPWSPGEWLDICIDPRAPLGSLGLLLRTACLRGIRINKAHIRGEAGQAPIRERLPLRVGTACYPDVPRHVVRLAVAPGMEIGFQLWDVEGDSRLVQDFEELEAYIIRVQPYYIGLLLEGQAEWRYARDALIRLQEYMRQRIPKSKLEFEL